MHKHSPPPSPSYIFLHITGHKFSSIFYLTFIPSTFLSFLAHYSEMSLEEYGKNTISVGPWGGQDGFRWDDGVYSTVKQLVIAHGAGIDSIRIEYEKNGTSVWSEKHGGSGGIKTDKVKLEYPDEYLTSIHGHYGSLNEWGPVFVRSLTFESNKKIYGPYGIEQGMYFSLPMTGGKVVGFHGKRGWYLDAIGAHLEPLYKPNPPKSLNSVAAYGTDPKSGYSIIQGSFGQKFDMVLALKQKDDYANSSPNNMSRQSSSSSQEFSDTDSKAKSVQTYGVSNAFVRVPSNDAKGVMTYGTWGGTGGTVFDDGVYTGIKQIILSRHVGIVSIRVLYDQNDQPIWGSKNGGTGGFKHDKIFFDYPYEILTHMTGFHGPTMLMGPTVIKSLTFHTTKTKYGPFGEETGQSFSTNLKEGKIVGFHGRKGLFVDAIGVHVVEGKVFPLIRSPSNSFNQSEVPINEVDNQQRPNKPVQVKQALTEELFGHRVVKEPTQGGPGPWGGEGGRQWDDGVFMGIKQIHLTRSNAICSIQIEYDRSGQSVWSAKHGGDGGGTVIPIKLEYPNEVLTCISGFYGPIRGDEVTKVIKSLTFHTSRRKFGPYGEEIGTYFTSVTTEGKVVGFHGRSGMYLDAIGVHMQHWLGNQRQIKPSSLRKFFY